MLVNAILRNKVIFGKKSYIQNGDRGKEGSGITTLLAEVWQLKEIRGKTGTGRLPMSLGKKFGKDTLFRNYKLGIEIFK